jgi:hypothetical protein
LRTHSTATGSTPEEDLRSISSATILDLAYKPRRFLMPNIDLHKLALQLKVTEMIKIHARRRLMAEAYEYWCRLIQTN